VIAIVLLGRWQTTLLLLLLTVLATGSPDLYRAAWSGRTAMSGAGNWMMSYMGMLLFTAPYG
jgi:hypothetical protein